MVGPNEINFFSLCISMHLGCYPDIKHYIRKFAQHIFSSWVAQDVICFDSFLDQKMFDKVIVKVSLSVVVVIF